MKMMGMVFEEQWVSLFVDTTKSNLEPFFSNYKVPVLLDNGFVIWDSLSIMEYVSEKYLDGKGWPADQKLRAKARSISAEMHSSFSHLRNAMPMNCRGKFSNFNILPDVKKDIDRVKDIWNKCKNEHGSKGEWLFGAYSIADAMFAPVVLRFEGYGVELNDLEKAYVQATLNQSHMQDWIEAGKKEKEIIMLDEVES